MKIKLKFIYEILIVIVIVIVFYIIGILIHKITGFEIFYIPKVENLSFKDGILLITTILATSRLFKTSLADKTINKLFTLEPEIKIEVDKRVILVGEYNFISNTSLDPRKSEINYINTIFHVGVLLYNSTLSEITIKSIYLIFEDNKRYRADNEVIEGPNGWSRGLNFKQELIFKTKELNRRFTFVSDEATDRIEKKDLDTLLNPISIEVVYSNNGKEKTITKELLIDIDSQKILAMKSEKHNDLHNWFVNMPDFRDGDNQVGYNRTQGRHYDSKFK